jgi:hypothetical protein
VSRALLFALLAAWAGACARPPPSHALIVRDPASKCALVMFSGCAVVLGQSEADAGSE